MTGKCALSLLSYEQTYVEHLAEVNDVMDVIATEDIYSRTHALLVAKGDHLDHEAVVRIKQHTLIKLLDTQIEISNSLNNHRIYQQILAMIADNPDIQDIHHRCKHADKLQPICLAESIPLPLRTKLTVMAERMPDEYEHCLFSAWASMIIALEMELPQRDVQFAFICGLFHDIGLIHLNGDFSDRENLSSEDWRTLQSHVVISAMILKELGNYPNSVSVGVLEHHERIDQTGYPTRKTGFKLNTFGQIVGSADLLYKICTNELDDQSHRLTASLPYFKMHRGAYRESIFNSIVRILNRCEYHPDCILSPEVAQLQAIQVSNKLRDMESDISSLMELMADQYASPCCLALTTMGLSLLETIRQSGITMGHTQDFLNSAEAAEEIDDLIEISAMQHELLWLFKRFSWSLDDVLDHLPEWPEQEMFQTQAHKFHTTLQSAWQIVTD